MSVTAGIQYYWLNTELVLLLLLKNQGDRLDPRPGSHSFKGMGRPPAEAATATARGQDAPVGAGDPQEVWRQGNFCLPCVRAFQMGADHPQRGGNGPWRPRVCPWGSRAASTAAHAQWSSSALPGTTWTPGSRRAQVLGGQVGPPAWRQDHLLSR